MGFVGAVEFFEEGDGAVEGGGDAEGVVEKERDGEVVTERVAGVSGGFGGLRETKVGVGADGEEFGRGGAFDGVLKRGVRGGEVGGEKLQLAKEERGGSGGRGVEFDGERGAEAGDGVGIFVLAVERAGKEEVGFLLQRGAWFPAGEERARGGFGKRGFFGFELELREPEKRGLWQNKILRHEVLKTFSGFGFAVLL